MPTPTTVDQPTCAQKARAAFWAYISKHTDPNGPTTFTEPRMSCWDDDVDPCNHDDNHYRKWSSCKISDTGPLGLRRGKDGAYRWPTTKPPRPKSLLPTSTCENIAACTALGLSYWSEGPRPGQLWAVDAEQRPHIVDIDRTRRTAIAHRVEVEPFDARGKRYNGYRTVGNYIGRVSWYPVDRAVNQLAI